MFMMPAAWRVPDRSYALGVLTGALTRPRHHRAAAGWQKFTDWI
jgi:hypothetical protein